MKKSTLYKCAYLLGAVVLASFSKYILKTDPCDMLIIYTGMAIIDTVITRDEE